MKRGAVGQEDRPESGIWNLESGFTLIEILVVVIIIGILASLTLVGVMAAIRTSRRSATRALIENLNAAGENYRTRWGDYPPTTMAEYKVRLPNELNTGIESLTASLCSTDRGGKLFEPPGEDVFGNVDRDRADKNWTNWFFGDNELREILDSWRRPLTYMHSKDYARANAAVSKYQFVAEGDEVQIKPVKTQTTKTYARSDKFQIFSAGEDGIPNNADDEVGW